MPPAPAAPPPTAPPARPAAPPDDATAYNPANQPSTRGARAPSPELTAALNKAAGVAVPPAAPAASPAPATPPAAPPTAPAPPAPPSSDDRPAPHVKFIAADDRDELAAPAAPPPTPEPEPTAPKELRAAFNRVRDERDSILKERDLTRKEAAEYRAKLAALEERAKTLEADSTRAKDLEGRVSVLDEQLRVANYLQHPEFHDRYVKPVAEAISSAHELVAQITVEDNGSQRPAQPSDFDAVLRAPDLTEATRRARALFGEDSTIVSAVIGQRQLVLAAERQRAQAMKTAALDSQKWVEQRQAAELRARTEARAIFDRASSALAAKHASLYLPPEGDREAAEARRSGEELANSLLGTSEPIPQDQYLANMAKIHHRASAFPMLQLKYERIEAENAALKVKLAAYEASTPDVRGRNGDGSLTPGATAPNDYSAQMRAALEAKAREGNRR